MLEHVCKERIGAVYAAYGDAITYIGYDVKRQKWFAENGEYATSIIFCPWCGKKL